jgi:hypothetical protein
MRPLAELVHPPLETLAWVVKGFLDATASKLLVSHIYEKRRGGTT